MGFRTYILGVTMEGSFLLGQKVTNAIYGKIFLFRAR